MISKTIFRTYDIRGRIPGDFTLQDGFIIAHAILDYYQQQVTYLDAIVLGRDARTTSNDLAQHVHAAAHARGIAVHDLGVCSSPEVYFTLATNSIKHSIMVTASHNEASYNGYKLRLNAEPLSKQDLLAIHNLCQKQSHPALATNSTPGWILDKAQAETISPIPVQQKQTSEYLSYLTQSFFHLAGSETHAIIDTHAGSAGPVVSALVKNLNLSNVTVVNELANGLFPHNKPDPSFAKNSARLVAHVRAATVPTIGLALDGDGDRIMLVLEDGTVLSGDDILALLCAPILAQNPGTSVVYDVKTSSRLIKTVEKFGSNGYFSACGHPYIQKSMLTHNALLGGEVSGHLFFKDSYFGFDDGIYALLRILELREKTGTPLHSLFTQLPQTFASAEQRIFCDENLKEAFVTEVIVKTAAWADSTVDTTDGVRITFPHGWILIRASQTEPALSIRYEGDTREAFEQLSLQLHALLPSLTLTKGPESATPPSL